MHLPPRSHRPLSHTRRALAAALPLVALLACLLAVPARAAAPLPAAPGAAPDFADRLARKMAFDRRTMVDAYERVGRRDGRWNQQAERYLEDTVAYLAGTPDSPSPQRLLQAGAALMELGCDDPLIQYCHGRNLMVAGRLDSAEPLLAMATVGLAASQYPPCRAYFAGLRYAAVLAQQRKYDELTDLEPRLMDLMLRTVDGEDYPLPDERVVYMYLSDAVSGLSLAQIPLIVNGLDAHKAPENAFLHAMLLGDLARRQAAAVIQDGADYSQLLSMEREVVDRLVLEARTHYEAAARAAGVATPEPAVGLLACALLVGPEAGSGYRDLFDRAVAAEFDNPDAYAYLFAAYARRPDVNAIRALADACAATGRYDTAVPEHFVTQMLALARLPGGPGYAYWTSDADIWPTFDRVLGSVAANRRATGDRLWTDSLHAAIAWRYGRYEQAARLLDDLGRQMTVKAFSEVGGPPVSAVVEIYALTGPAKVDLQRALTAERDGRFETALAVYRRHENHAHPETQVYVAHRIRALDWRQRYESGSPVHLETGDSLRGWLKYSPGWTSENAELTLEDPGTSATIIADLQTGNRVELAAHIDLGVNLLSVPVAAGVILGRTESGGPPTDIRCVIESKPFVHLAIYERGELLQRRPLPLRQKQQMRVLLFDRQITVWVDEKPIVQNLQTRDNLRYTDKRVGATVSVVGGSDRPTVSSLIVKRPENGRVPGMIELRNYRDAMATLSRRDYPAAKAALEPLAQSAELPWVQARARIELAGIAAMDQVTIGEASVLPTLFSGAAGWHAEGGGWTLENGDILCKTRPGLSLLLLPFAGNDYSLEVDVNVRSPDPQLILLGYRDDAEPVVLTLDNGLLYFGWPGMPQRFAVGRLASREPVPITVTVHGSVVTVHTRSTFLLGLDLQRSITGHAAVGVVGNRDARNVTFGQPRFTWHPLPQP